MGIYLGVDNPTLLSIRSLILINCRFSDLFNDFDIWRLSKSQKKFKRQLFGIKRTAAVKSVISYGSVLIVWQQVLYIQRQTHDVNQKT